METNREFVKGAVAGGIAAAVMYVFIEFFRWIGVTEFGLSYLSGDTVFNFQNNIVMNVIALIIAIGVGMFWGVILAFLFSKVLSGDFYQFKAVFISFCIFFFHLGFLDEPFHYTRKIHDKTLDLLIILAGYLLYGYLLGLMFKKLKLIRE